MASLGIAIAAFSQAAGRIVVDTKLDLAIDPARFLSFATKLWDYRSTFGQVQNQADGYLFPMGPFYLLGHVLGVPAWITQRAWLSLLLLGALWGVLKLAEELDIGTRYTRLLAAFAYACSPFVLAAAMASAGLIPEALLPWAVLPLVRAYHGKTAPMRAVALSGLAVLGMGGVNATATMAVLPMPMLWMLTRRRSRERNHMVAWWLVAVVLATAWFVMALLFQGKYGLDFLKYTESARTTTEWTSLPEILRGAGLWMSLIAIHGLWTPAGWMIENFSPVIVATAAVAAMGLYGIARRDMPERVFVVVTLFVGMLAASIGYWGHLGSPAAHIVHALLVGPLAPFRNVNKFEPLVTLSIALGLAHGLGAVRMPRTALPTLWLRRAGYMCALAVVLVASLPLLTGKVYPDGSFRKLPSYWTQAIDWLNAHGGHDTTLVIPGESFARFTWGVTDDQPLEPLSKVPWAVRNIVPLGSVGNTMYMDAVDTALTAGEPTPGLAAYLARGGVKYLFVENDLNPLLVASPPPTVIRSILAQEPGITRVARFGPVIAQPDAGASAGIDFSPTVSTSRLRSIEIYKVDGSVPAVTTYPAGHGVVVTGGPQALLAMAGAGDLGGEATALAGDPLGPKFPHPTWVVADTEQRRDINFGQLYDDASYVLTSREMAPTNAGTTGGTKPSRPTQWEVVPGASHETVAVLHGAASVTSSSYGTPIDRLPGYQPLGAFLSHPESAAWAASATNVPDPWIQITFDHPVPVDHISIEPLDDGPWRPVVTQVRVTTDRGSLTSSLVPRQRLQTIPTPPGPTTRLRVTITAFDKAAIAGSDTGPGFAHIGIPGVKVSESWKLPDDGGAAAAPGAPAPTYFFSSPIPNPFEYLRPPDDEPHMSRIFTVPARASFHVTATVTPRPGPGLLALVAGNSPLKVSATSTFADLPLFRPQNLVDGATLTSWWAGSGDPHPAVTMSWPGTHVLDSVDVATDPAASAPEQLLIRSGTASRLVAVPAGGGLLRFAPLAAHRVVITFPKIRALPTLDILTGHLMATPVGLSELTFPALSKLPITPFSLSAPFSLPCGSGPPLSVNGVTVPTSVHGTMGDIYSLAPMPLRLCGPTGSTLTLQAGQNRIDALDAGYGMKVTSLTLAGAPIPHTSGTGTSGTGTSGTGTSGTGTSGTGTRPPRTVRIDTWAGQSRTLTVGPGRAAILDVRQNYNSGWAATAGGLTLHPVRLDGWQQGWMLPPSASPETVRLYYAPAGAFRLALLVGLLLALALVAWALWPPRRRPPWQRRKPGGIPVPAMDTHPRRRLPSGVLGAAALTMGMFLLGGPLVALVPVVLLAFRRQRRREYRILGTGGTVSLDSERSAEPLPWIAGGTMLLAGVMMAVRPGTLWDAWFGALSYSAQLLAGTALIAVVAASVPGLPRLRHLLRHARGRSQPAAPPSRGG